MKRLLASGLLALLLAFAQQAATLHWLSHAVDATHAKAPKGSASSGHCDECLALGALGAAAPASASASVATGGTGAWRLALPATPAPTALRLAFRSRAPPVLV